MKDFNQKFEILIIHILNFVINKNKSLEFELLNKARKYNLKNFKFNEIKIYINNRYIVKFGLLNYDIYNHIVDINHMIIMSTNQIDTENFKIIDFYNYIFIHDSVIVSLYTKLHNKKITLNNDNNIITQKIESDKINNDDKINDDDKKDNSFVFEKVIINESNNSIYDWLDN